MNELPWYKILFFMGALLLIGNTAFFYRHELAAAPSITPQEAQEQCVADMQAWLEKSIDTPDVIWNAVCKALKRPPKCQVNQEDIKTYVDGEIARCVAERLKGKKYEFGN